MTKSSGIEGYNYNIFTIRKQVKLYAFSACYYIVVKM